MCWCVCIRECVSVRVQYYLCIHMYILFIYLVCMCVCVCVHKCVYIYILVYIGLSLSLSLSLYRSLSLSLLRVCTCVCECQCVMQNCCEKLPRSISKGECAAYCCRGIYDWWARCPWLDIPCICVRESEWVCPWVCSIMCNVHTQMCIFACRMLGRNECAEPSSSAPVRRPQVLYCWCVTVQWHNIHCPTALCGIHNVLCGLFACSVPFSVFSK